MKCDLCGGPLEDRTISYAIEYEGHLHIIEHVPVKECLQCGERLYSPQTVEKIQNAIWHGQKPDKVIETPVIDYASIDMNTDL
ncbi:MAG: YgiT-type zinc finger protein [bacterium]